MAKLPPDPPWSWITHEVGNISTSPLEAVFSHDRQPAQEFAGPATKRQKLGFASSGPLLSNYSIEEEKPPGSSRQYSHHVTPPNSRNGKFSERSRHESYAHDILHQNNDFFPARPPSASSVRNDQKCLIEKDIIPTVQGSSSGIAVPYSAPRYPKEVIADSYFWAGNQSEDILNEQSTKNGFFDRSPPPINDLNTARPTIWSCLKHRSGLQVLSSLFVATLSQRQSNGTIPSSGTFKPPPRVTLTDTKRETWLRDLADTLVPLRRLSRTIPHGIRGKALLDHCLSKNVPSWRAVWLAKCVGANEVRASKRKGSSGTTTAGGEVRWTEEWTQNIEQFLELLLIDCSIQNWRVHIVYVLQLVAHFYSEQLLDRRHFVDWVTTSFKDCKVDRIPIWLLAVRLHWKEIWRFRHSGKQLAEAILQRILDISGFPEYMTFNPLLQQLLALLRTSVNAFPDSYILPECWGKFSSVLEHHQGQEHESDSVCFKQLMNRNKNLARSTNGVICTLKDMPRQKIISTLDGLTGSFDIKMVSLRCRDAAKDSTTLVNTTLEWSSTPFRLNSNRLYLGVRLLRLWKEEGIEIDQPILDLIAVDPTPPNLQARSVCRIVIELIRSRHFSISRYLQWLLAREPFLFSYATDAMDLVPQGPLSKSGITQLSELPFLLLRELPLQGLPEHTLNLRTTLLDRYGYSVRDETEKVAAIRGILSQILPGACDWNGPVVVNFNALDHVEINSRSLIADASHFIRNTIVARKQHQRTLPGSRSQLLSVAEFEFTRRFFEKHEDFSVFADVMKIVAGSSNTKLLHDVTSTLNWQLEVFQAIGAAEAIFWDLFARAEDIIGRKAIDLPFLLTLADLSERIPSSPSSRRFLRREIELRNPAPPITACSPVADPDAELLEGSDTTFLEEMEMVFTSGNSMDRLALSRFFLLITTRVEKGWKNSYLPLRSLFDLLYRLRQFDAEALDDMLEEWLQTVVVTKFRQDLPRIVIPLVCSGTVALRSVIDIMAGYLDTLDNESYHFELGQQLLSLLMAGLEHDEAAKNDDARLELRTYRWAAERDRLLQTETKSILFLVRTVLDQKAHSQAHSECGTCALISAPSFGSLLHTIIIYQPRIRRELEEYLTSNSSHTSLDRLGNRLLELVTLHQIKAPYDTSIIHINSIRPDAPGPHVEHHVERLLDAVDDFNIAFSRLNLIILLRQLKAQPEDDSYMRVMTKLVSAIVSAGITKHELMLDFIFVLNSEHALEIHTRASLILFTSLSALIPGGGSVDFGGAGQLKKLLSLIDVAETRISGDQPTIIGKKLSDTVVALRTSIQHNDVSHQENNPSHSVRWILGHDFHHCINIILRLIVIHQSRLHIPHVPETLISQLVIDLAIILVQPTIQTQSALLSFLFDHIALLSDQLTVESRGICLHALRYQHIIHDPRFDYLLGCPGYTSSGSLRLTYSSPRSYDRTKHANSSSSTRSDSHSAPFVLRKWEMVQDATPNASENDTSLNLSLFGARKGLN